MFILLGMTGALWRLAQQEDDLPLTKVRLQVSVPHAT
jgi:hypothetical protein